MLGTALLIVTLGFYRTAGRSRTVPAQALPIGAGFDA
jgi:hypothetical protein